jgi:hypothetical protein
MVPLGAYYQGHSSLSKAEIEMATNVRMLPEILKWLEHAYSLKATEFVIMEKRSRARQLTWDYLTRNQLSITMTLRLAKAANFSLRIFESFAKTL